MCLRASADLPGNRKAALLSGFLVLSTFQAGEAREKRVKPGRDDKVLAGWNGLMIQGLAFASRVFDRPDWAEAASG